MFNIIIGEFRWDDKYLNSDRSELAGKAKNPGYGEQNQYPYIARNAQNGASAENNEDQGTVGDINSDTTQITTTGPATVQKENNTSKQAVKRKQGSSDELKQAKAADSKLKRLKTTERDATTASYMQLLDGDDKSPKMNIDMKVVMDILKKIQAKVDDTYDVVETLLSCKYCLRKSYKRLESSPSRGSGISGTPMQKKLSEMRFEHQQSCSSGHRSGNLETVHGSTASNREVHSIPETDCAIHTPPPPPPPPMSAAPESTLSIDPESVEMSDTDLVYVGESQHGVRVSRETLNRCEKTAKCAEKLALNLIEVILTPEEIATCTMYGNNQHNKKAIEESKRKALRTHILGKFKDTDWEKLVRIINDKIRKMKRKLDS